MATAVGPGPPRPLPPRRGARRGLGAVFVAQLPPPVHGQAVATQHLVSGSFRCLSLDHVDLAAASDLGDVGRFRARKLLQVLSLIARVSTRRLRGSGDVLIYALGARSRLPVLRDLVVLALVRPLFRHTVFHVHTGDYGARLGALPNPLRAAVSRVFGGAHVIYLDERLDEPDGRLPSPRSVGYLPYGVEDLGAVAAPLRGSNGDPPGEPVVLFVGNLYRTKGTHDLVRAAGLLRRRGLRFRVVLAGGLPDQPEEEALRKLVAEEGVGDCVDFAGIVAGEGKRAAFAAASVFCFPTYYEAEGMPLVVLEAMAARLPVVATRWRAIPSVVEDGVTGFLVEPHDVEALAERLERLLTGPALAAELGARARARYEERFSVERFCSAFEELVAEAVHGGDAGGHRPTESTEVTRRRRRWR